MSDNIDYQANEVQTAKSFTSSHGFINKSFQWFVFFSVCAATILYPIVHLQVHIWGFEHFIERFALVTVWYPSAFNRYFTPALLGIAIGFLLLALVLKTRYKKDSFWKKIRVPFLGSKPKGSALHGTAGWAEFDDIKQMALLPPGRLGEEGQHDGVFVGAYPDPKNPKHDIYLRHNGPEHVLAFAPTRSGKGVGLVLPTLLDWRESALVHDPKGECWALTSGFRSEKLGQRVFNFDVVNPNTSEVHAFNPLSEVRVGTTHEVADAQNIATILVDPEGKGLKDHWDKTAQALTSALILHICRKSVQEDQMPTFSALAKAVSNPEASGIDDLFNEMKQATYYDGQAHPMVAEEAQVMLNKEEKEKTSVLSTVVSNLGLFRDPAVIANTSRSDWKVNDLMNGEKPATCYLVVRPSDADRIRPLIRLICTQIVRSLTEKMRYEGGRAFGNYKHRLLLLLDEFTALRKMDVVQQALAYMAGYGIKAYLIVQDIEQLKAVYGREETVISNCHVRIAFAPNKIETAKTISEMAGTKTVVYKQADFGKKSDGGHWSETSRPLITPEEAMRLRGAQKDSKGNIVQAGDLLVFVAGFRPIYGRQVLYFRDKRLNERSRMLPPDLVADDIMRYDPNQRHMDAPDDIQELIEGVESKQWRSADAIDQLGDKIQAVQGHGQFKMDAATRKEIAEQQPAEAESEIEDMADLDPLDEMDALVPSIPTPLKTPSDSGLRRYIRSADAKLREWDEEVEVERLKAFA